MLSKEEIEKAKENIIKQLENTKKANECGLATKGEFNEDIDAIETLLQYIDQLEQENKNLKMVLDSGLDKNKKYCFNEDGNTGKCLGYSNVDDDEPCKYCKSCEAINVKGDD